MQIDSQSAHALSLFSYTNRATNDPARTQSADFAGQSPAVAQAQAQAAPAYSAMVSPFEQDTLSYINSLLQKEGKDTYSLEEWRSHQTDLRVEHLQKIANDPVYAEEQASLMAKSFDGLLIPTDVFESYTSQGLLPPGSYAMDDPNNPVIQVRDQRQDFYNQKVAEGLSPAETYMEMLKFNMALPDSYADGALDPTGSYPQGFWKSQFAKDYEILSAIMNPLDTSA